MSTSRRKQNHPNKFGAKENSTVIVDNQQQVKENGKIKTEPPEVEMTTLCKQEGVVSPSVIIRAGATFGPFPYSTTDDSTEDNLITITDVSGKSKSYRMKESLAHQWLEQLSFSATLDESNSVLRDDGSELKLTVTKDVSSVKDFIVALETDPNLPNGHESSSDAISPQSSENMPVLAPEKKAILTKNFACDSCGTRFSNPKTLAAHKTFYCGKTFNPSATENVSPKDLGLRRASITSGVDNSNATTTTTTISIDCNANLEQQLRTLPLPINNNNNNNHHQFINLPLSASPVGQFLAGGNNPNVILLPCAYTDSDVVQVVGYPQTIIPVAVSRNMQIAGRHVILEEALLNGVRFPVDHLTIDRHPSNAFNVTNGNCKSQLPNKRSETSPFKLSLAVKTNAGVVRVITPSPSQPPPSLIVVGHSSPGAQMQHTADKSCSPCPPNTSGPSYQNRSAINTTALTGGGGGGGGGNVKAFPCPNCGVTFSSEKTLDGHLSFYCSANKNQQKVDPKLQRKIVENQRLCCHLCDVTVGTAAELTDHVKLEHDDTTCQVSSAPFTCDRCEFKANSARGVKTHVKYAHSTATVSPATGDDNKIHTCRSDAGTPTITTTTTTTTTTTKTITTIVNGNGFSHRRDDDDDNDDEEPDWKRRRASYPLLSNSGYSQNTTLKLSKLNANSINGGDEIRSSSSSAENTAKSTPNNNSNNNNDLVTKYKCKFCTYQSPYKGNVKRHLTLVHKNAAGESNKKGDNESELL